MAHEALLKQARAIYAQWGRKDGSSAVEPFPPAPDAVLGPAEFVDRMIEAVFKRSAKLHHPFALRLARGEWSKGQIREWARQEYAQTVYALRRHALIAANAPDYETIWGLIARVKAEADADPVGGTFFALPQLWLKFGIALGLQRREMIESTPHPELRRANEAMIGELRVSGAMPVTDFVDAILDPIFYQLWGEALENALGLPRESLDYFWAIAADKWGLETGRSILAKCAASDASKESVKRAQSELWKRLAEEVKQGREWHRFSILESLLERAAESGC